MKTSHLGLLGLILVAAPLGACSETAVGTDTVRTKGLWAAFEVKSTGPSTKLTAKLRVGGSSGTPAYPLTGADELLYSVDGSAEAGFDETCEQSNTFCTGNLGDISGKTLRVNFDRGSDVENAPNSTVKMPKAFDVAAKNDELVRGVDDVELTISGGSSGLRYRVTGDCIWTEEGTITDNAIPASKITSPRSDANEDCDVQVVVTRTVEGDLDPNYGKGGQIVAIQERKFTFFSLANANPPVTTPDAGGTTDVSSSDTSGDAGIADAGDVTDDGGVNTEDGGVNTDAGGSSIDGGEASSDVLDASTGASSSTSSGESSSAPEASSDVADAGDAG